MSSNLRRSPGAAPGKAESADPLMGTGQWNAVAEIVWAVRDRHPVVALTGPAGIGKTAVLRKALEQLRALGERIVEIDLPDLDRLQSGERGAQLALEALGGRISASQRKLGSHVLLMDDAHRLSQGTLEFLLRLAGRHTAGEPAWQVILSGRPDLWEVVRHGALGGLGTAAPVHCSLEGLSEAEARALVARHLGQGEGSVPRAITTDALSLLLEVGQGIPGRLIALLDTARAASGARAPGVITRDAIASVAGLPRSAGAQPRLGRAERHAAHRWLTPSVGGVSGVLMLTIGVAAWQLLVSPDEVLTQAARAGAPPPAAQEQAGRVATTPVGFALAADQIEEKPTQASAASTPPPGISADLAAAVAEAAKLLESAPEGSENAGAERTEADSGTPAGTDADTDPSGPEAQTEQPAATPGAQQAPPTPAEQAGPGPAQAPGPVMRPSLSAPAEPAGTRSGAEQAPPAPTEQAGTAPAPAQAPEAAAPPLAGPAPASEGGQPQPAPAPSAPAQSGEPRTTALANPARPAPSERQNSVAPATLDTGAASGAQRMSQALIDTLLARGDALFAVGDVSGARRFYERAAGGGSARAAATVGKTYDPAFLAAIKARGMQPDPSAAAAWYRTATALGDPEAPRLLERLGAEPNR